MRIFQALIPAGLLLATAAFADKPHAVPFPGTERPFGKYLVEICTIDHASNAVSCAAPPPLPAAEKPAPKGGDHKAGSHAGKKTPQTITLKQVCAPGSAAICSPA